MRPRRQILYSSTVHIGRKDVLPPLALPFIPMAIEQGRVNPSLELALRFVVQRPFVAGIVRATLRIYLGQEHQLLSIRRNNLTRGLVER